MITAQDTPGAIFERFIEDMHKLGQGVAPNGAMYRLTTYGQQQTPAFRRIAPDGSTELIVGFNSELFETKKHATAWAITDGRHELPIERGRVQTMPINRRKAIV